MQNTTFPTKLFFSLSLFSLFYLFSCNKLDTTTIGTDLIPTVDNVNTFDTSLDIITSQNWFTPDSTKLSLIEDYVVGKINDPILGNMDAALYLQMKPPFYPYFIGKVPKDTIEKADSVVLCLSYRSFWGDSTQPINLRVYEVPVGAGGQWDSVYQLQTVNYAPALGNPISDVKSVDIRQLSNYTKLGLYDSVNNQIRIKLSDDFKNSLFSRDTSQNTSKNAFLNDSLFRRFQNGFAITASSGNSLLYLSPVDFKTRLELHYKKRTRTQNDTGYLAKIDTVYSSFYFNSNLNGEIIRKSAICNKINRDRNPLPAGDQKIYLVTSPGTYANLEIPGLTGFPNKIVHRAELQISQIPDPINDKIYTPSRFLYLDLIDTGTTAKWKPIYFDLNPDAYYDPDYKTPGFPYYPYSGENISYFGGYLRERTTTMGQQSYYTINITKYIQQIATKKTTNYKLRLFPAHSVTYPQYASSVFPYRNAVAYGRTLVGGGNNPNPDYKMRLRIVYSNPK